jgi:hypothetical protein
MNFKCKIIFDINIVAFLNIHIVIDFMSKNMDEF